MINGKAILLGLVVATVVFVLCMHVRDKEDDSE